MSVNPIAAVGTGASAPPTPAADVGASQTFDVLPEGVAPMQAGAFSGAGGAFDSMVSAINSLNDELLAGDQATRGLALGNTDNLHQSMMALEHARLSLQLMLQVRSRMLDAYQQLMQMQI